MGKSLNGKELGKGISQRKDGLYQGRFTNRFGRKQTVYGKTYNEVRKKLRDAQYEDEKCLNVVTKDVTLDEWFEIWLDTFKKNCRDSAKETYRTQYERVKEALGWRKLTSLNLLILQNAFNELCSDNARKTSKKLLVAMLNQAIDSHLLTTNVAKQLNTVIPKEEFEEETEKRKALTRKETKIFLEEAVKSSYYNLFVLAFETGLRIGEIMGLTWADIDFKKKQIHVRRTLCYFRKDGKYIFEIHKCKTKKSKRKVPMTTNAYNALKRQQVQKERIEAKGKVAPEEYKNLVFVTKNNQPTQQFIVQEAIDCVLNRVRTREPEFERFTPHCTRHTFATRCIEKKMQPKTLQELLGHASVKTTMDLYCHVTNETLEDALELMEQDLTD
ncbi:MAG: tyrosine-type recombinase/integrase [Roseburia sp.]|nr:tyrosine-type recombinase/integrase [Roseburia sp.]